MKGHINPGDPAPEQGHYLEHNVFGSSSYPRRVVWCEAGELPWFEDSGIERRADDQD
jgi:hypothetical protein